jgi:putative membrane protein
MPALRLLGRDPEEAQPVDADDSARMRDLLASNRTMLAWIRTSLSFAGLGFVVAKFGRTAGMIHFALALGIFLALVGLLFTVIGYAQHHATLIVENPPPGAPAPLRWPAVTAAACCAVTCVLVVAYLAVSA